MRKEELKPMDVVAIVVFFFALAAFVTRISI